MLPLFLLALLVLLTVLTYYSPLWVIIGGTAAIGALGAAGAFPLGLMFFLAWLGGLGLGIGMRRGVRPERLLVEVTAGVGAVIFVIFLVAEQAWGIKIGAELEQTLGAMLREVLSVQRFPELGDPAERMKLSNMLQTRLTLALPAAFLLSELFWVGTAYAIASWFLTGRGASLPPFLPLAHWRFPWWIVWVLILDLVFFLRGEGKLPFGLQSAVSSSFLLLLFLYLLQGVAVVWAWLLRLRLQPGWRLLLLFVFAFGFGQILPWIGILDTWMDFRRLERQT